jgi:hypothetical protein
MRSAAGHGNVLPVFAGREKRFYELISGEILDHSKSDLVKIETWSKIISLTIYYGETNNEQITNHALIRISGLEQH